MDATRQFRFTVYRPIDLDGYYDDETILTLEEAWHYYEETGCTRFLACDAMSLENNCCVLDFTNLTTIEMDDLYRALKGR